MNYEVIENLMAEGYKVRIGLAESLGVSAETQEIGQIGIVKTLDLQRHSFGAAQTIYLPTKRAFDLLLGIAGCAITLPVAAIVKISYLVTGDTHPVFYKQTRIGLRGKPFQLWKLRSMVWNADEILAELLQDPKRYDEWRRSQKLDDDPRITPVGRLLRQTSLDELPQFFNVIMGDMSIIGPRPLVPGELEEHGGRPLYNEAWAHWLVGLQWALGHRIRRASRPGVLLCRQLFSLFRYLMHTSNCSRCVKRSGAQ
ncbi:MAG: sugar transferase [Adlercreutzia sp.]